MAALPPVNDQPVRETIAKLIDQGREIGIQVAAYRHNDKVLDVAMGVAAENGTEPVTPDTLFSIYSVSKGIAATCLHLLVDRGLLDIDRPIVDYWPEFGANGKQEITLRDVLTHRAGIPQMPDGVTPERICDWSWMTAHIAELAPIMTPRKDNAYMAMSFGWVVGEVIRRVDPKHRMVSQFLREEFCEPLGIRDLYLALPDEAFSRYAAHSIVPDPIPPADSLNVKALPMSVRLVPDVFSRRDVLQSDIPAVNGVASASSLARFFALLANEGELDGVRILSRDRVRDLLVARTEEEEFEPVLGRPWLLSTGGFFLASSHKPAVGSSREMIFAMGMGGTIAWADMGSRVAVAITHNKMFNARTSDEDPILAVAESVRRALGLME